MIDIDRGRRLAGQLVRVVDGGRLPVGPEQHIVHDGQRVRVVHHPTRSEYWWYTILQGQRVLVVHHPTRSESTGGVVVHHPTSFIVVQQQFNAGLTPV